MGTAIKHPKPDH